MYSTLWSRGLRQGDIVGEIAFPLLGAQFEVLARSASLVEPPSEPVQRIVVPAPAEYVVVVSHDCEFNEGKRNKLLIARLQAMPGNLAGEQLEALRESNNLEARVANKLSVAGVDSFVFAPIAGVSETELVANFGTITPLPMKLKDQLLDKKRAELLHEHRVFFRKKLAWFVGRDAEDMPDEEKSAPTTS